MMITPKKSEESTSDEEEKQALARRIRRRLLLLRCLREGAVGLLAVLSLALLLGMPAWDPRLAFLYDWLPLRPARALCVLCCPDIVIDGELAYDVAFADVLLFYGAILIIPWTWLCRRHLWIPSLLLAVAVLFCFSA